MKLGVNIDHIAVLREARKIADPNPLDALPICNRAGVDQITVHLREDRRHMQDHDTQNIITLSALPVNLECATEKSMIDIACDLKPHRVTLVPEKREEVTTEGGLQIQGNQPALTDAIKRLQAEQIEVSLFIDPTEALVKTSKELGVEWIEFHTGKYANIYAMLYSNLSKTPHTIPELELPRNQLKDMLGTELKNLETVAKLASELGLKVAYQNVAPIVAMGHIQELNIGQSIIARSVYTGLEQAILEMKALLDAKS